MRKEGICRRFVCLKARFSRKLLVRGLGMCVGGAVGVGSWVRGQLSSHYEVLLSYRLHSNSNPLQQLRNTLTGLPYIYIFFPKILCCYMGDDSARLGDVRSN